MFFAVVAEVLTDFKVMYVFCSLSFCVCFDIFVSTVSVDELDIFGYAVFFVVTSENFRYLGER